MADIFDVIADATRRDLLSILLERYVRGADAPHGGEMSVGELVQTLGLSQPTVSKHLKVLRDFHLVTVREQGQHRFYRLDRGPLESVQDWLAPFAPPIPDGSQNGGMPAGAIPDGARRAAGRIGASAARIAHTASRFSRPFRAE